MSYTNRFHYKKYGRFNSRRGKNTSGTSSTSTPSTSHLSTDPSSLISADIPEAVRISRVQPLISIAFDVIPGPYPGWKLYFPTEGYSPGSQTVRKVKSVESHITRRPVLYNLPRCKKLSWYPISIRALLADALFTEEWPMFQEDLEAKPEYTLNCLGLAMHQILSMQNDSNFMLKYVAARIMGHGPIIPLRNIRVHSYGKVVTIKGTIIRAGNPKLLCTWMSFICKSCSAMQSVKQRAGVLTEPEKCVGDGCLIRSKFIPVLDTPMTRTVAWQTLKVQELKTADQFESGRIPRNMDVEVTSDLVDSCCPGDDVVITGIVQVRPVEENSRQGQATMYKMYIEGISIQNQRETGVEDELTEKDYAAINAIKSEPDVFRLLVNSLCPVICGQECPKAGLVLALMGGCPRMGTPKEFAGRGECHVLMVGDPGLGKSQMLKACADLAPRGVFVCGNTSSASGLTASASCTSKSSSDSSIAGTSCSGGVEAGALVLADGGVCCIDEFDKMTKQHPALLEAMEQQRVSLAKAGVVCSLPARCALIAAANPAQGVYDRSKTLLENINLDYALLSRFDLVFVLLDIPNEQLDEFLTRHIFSTLLNKNDKLNRERARTSCRQTQNVAPLLHERLKLKPGERFDALPARLFRKYISYARKNVEPKITDEAAEMLKKFWLELRLIRQGTESMPVTLRQLEALIRLTQARARVELSFEANTRHAQDILDLTKICLFDLFNDGLGTINVAGKKPAATFSQNTKAKKFLAILQKRSEMLMKFMFTTYEMKEMANNAGLLTSGMGSDFVTIIDKLNEQGFILKKGPELYQLLVVN